MSDQSTMDLVSYPDAVGRYDPVIGLETHVELGTVTKMFCGCPARFGGEQAPTPWSARSAWNTAPGSLPVTNRMAIEYTIKIGLAQELHDRRPGQVRAEELLLPGHAEGLPDLAVRRAAVHRRVAGHRGS